MTKRHDALFPPSPEYVNPKLTPDIRSDNDNSQRLLQKIKILDDYIDENWNFKPNNIELLEDFVNSESFLGNKSTEERSIEEKKLHQEQKTPPPPRKNANLNTLLKICSLYYKLATR